MPVHFPSQLATDSRRDDPLYYGERLPVYSSRGKQVLTLENGNGIRLENNAYLLMEGEWPEFDSELDTSSSRD